MKRREVARYAALITISIALFGYGKIIWQTHVSELILKKTSNITGDYHNLTSASQSNQSVAKNILPDTRNSSLHNDNALQTHEALNDTKGFKEIANIDRRIVNAVKDANWKPNKTAIDKVRNLFYRSPSKVLLTLLLSVSVCLSFFFGFCLGTHGT